MDFGTILFLTLIGLAAYLYLKRKELGGQGREDRAARKERLRYEKQAARENALPEVQTSLRVIHESIKLLESTKNQDTARSRYDVALKNLTNLIDQFPHRTDWVALHNELQQAGRAILQKLLALEIQKEVEKAQAAKTPSTKISRFVKALTAITTASSSEYYDSSWLAAQRAAIESMIHETELGKLMEAAERHEFKENWKKALDAYQDVLFYLKKDNIDDGEQTEIIEDIHAKTIEIKAKLEG
ncbi:hypothetical protein [Oleidesulfovibrio sp.]|uniref:hypothetical protein n=1 Tax=Oleidesulfovibrio sp. TaxID=2909707 RepID=UPI003A8B7DA9